MCSVCVNIRHLICFGLHVFCDILENSTDLLHKTEFANKDEQLQIIQSIWTSHVRQIHSINIVFFYWLLEFSALLNNGQISQHNVLQQPNKWHGSTKHMSILYIDILADISSADTHR